MDSKTLYSAFAAKNVLVTGGAGFIGSHLIEALVPLGANVYSLDNYIIGSINNHQDGCSYIKGDVANVLQLFKEQKFDYIYHFGEYSRVEQSVSEPNKALMNIYHTFPAILEFTRQQKAKLIYSGSSTKFADNGAGKALSPYTMSKSLNTELLAMYSNLYEIQCAIVYFYNVYGGREIALGKYATVVGKFSQLIEAGAKELPVTHPGTQKRNFTHINDVVAGLLIVGVHGEGDNYGIGADEEISILELVEMFGAEARIEPSNKANRNGGLLVTSRTKELGWAAQIKLEDYLRRKFGE